MKADRGQRRVLVVEDDAEAASMLERRLERAGYDVEVASDPASVVDRISLGVADWEVVVLDVGLPNMSGIELLKIFRQRGSMASIVMLTGDDSAYTATTCMRAGAFHYLTKPVDPSDLSIVIDSAARFSVSRRRSLERPGEKAPMPAVLIGESQPMQRLAAAIEHVAPQEVVVLLQGESGTGKEVVARSLHDRSARRNAPFVAVNCSSIPEGLIDSELFGHSKGAFTGAVSERQGVFVEAEGGTLFLDEIGDMPLQVQTRLLRALQEREIRPVGGTGTRKVDVRVVAATHVDLAKAVVEQRFRQDLYYRINVVTLELPPLRDRLEDIPLLAAHFLRKQAGASAPTLTPEALELLTSFGWPGNVRELENALMHAIAFQHDGVIGPEALPRHLWKGAKGSAPLPKLKDLEEDGALLPLTEAKRRVNSTFERTYLMKVMELAEGSISEAARLAGIDRTNLRRLLKRYEIEPQQFRKTR